MSFREHAKNRQKAEVDFARARTRFNLIPRTQRARSALYTPLPLRRTRIMRKHYGRAQA